MTIMCFSFQFLHFKTQHRTVDTQADLFWCVPELRIKPHLKVSIDVLPPAISQPQMDYQIVIDVAGRRRRLRRTDAAPTGALV